MALSYFYLAADAVAVLVFFFVLKAVMPSRSASRLPLPPGPKPFPFLGNLLDIPVKAPWATYAKWGKQYGDLTCVQAFGNTIIIANNVKTAKELFEKRGGIYSERPSIPFLEMIGLEHWNLSVLSYSHYFLPVRRLAEQAFKPAIVQEHAPMLKERSHRFMRLLLDSPEAFTDHIKFTVGSVIMDTIYGYDAKGLDDRYLTMAEEVMLILTVKMQPGALLVNIIPALRYLPSWLPGTGFKALADRAAKIYQDVRYNPYQMVKDDMKEGIARPSMVRDHLQRFQDGARISAAEEEALISAAGSVYGPGFDTTVSYLKTLFLVLALNPSVQDRAQADLDAVVGDGRLPDFSDRSSLPYIGAVVKELMRWGIVGPLALAHATVRDDEYNGYLIPKGAIVFGNSWQFLHDPEFYPDPDAFKPERYLSADNMTVLDDPNFNYIYGFGRRICPGRHLAEQSLWMYVASVLFCFRVSKAKDAFGNEIPIKCVWTDAIVTHPEEYQCSIVPRNERVRELIYAV